jgi:DNA-binding transcriptional LysR family regulator
MELRVLRYFLAVAREGNITVAANKLHLTQPTLSRQIRDLESELGQKLLARGSHSVRLTAEGEIFRKRAEEIVALADKTEKEFRDMQEGIKGDVYIGGGETEAMSRIAAVCRKIKDKYNDIRFHIYSGNAYDVTERLDKGLLDFGLLIHHDDIERYDHIMLPEKDIFGVIMRKDSPLAAKSNVTLEDIKKKPLVISRQSLEERFEENVLAKWFGNSWFELDIAGTYNLCYNASVMAEQGIGYVITSTVNMIGNTENSSLCFRPLFPKTEAAMALVWKKYQAFSAAAGLFLKKMQEDLNGFQFS